ncbi:MAG TPA: hypothetical protein VFB27_14775 [Opitutaceae bacterium]|nr:hypothetical protein [Opitutaceae bacterium]
MNKSAHAFVNQVLIGTLMMICFSGSLGLGTVWLRQQISLEANRNKQFEARLAEVNRRLDETAAAIAAAQSPEALKRRNDEWHLDLVPPREPQIVRVAGDVEQRLTAKNRARLFAGEGAATVTAVVYRPEGGR